MTTEKDLIENGRQIIDTRRRVWDLEQKARNKSAFYVEELKIARREYRRLLNVRKALVAQSQEKMFR